MLTKKLRTQFVDELKTTGDWTIISFDQTKMGTMRNLRMNCRYIAGRLGMTIKTYRKGSSLVVQRTDFAYPHQPKAIYDLTNRDDVELLFVLSELLRPFNADDENYDHLRTIFEAWQEALNALSVKLGEEKEAAHEA